jgi:hrgA protein
MKAVLQIAQEILQQSKTPLSPNKMWHIALKMGLTRELNLSGKTPWASFGAAIYVDVKNENSIFEVVQKKNRF